MKTLPLAHVKAHLSRLVDQVVQTDEQIVITRNGRPAAILVSPDEYEGWKETQAIRSDRELWPKSGVACGCSSAAPRFTPWRSSCPRTDAGGAGTMEPCRLRVPGRIAELVRTLHPELKRKVRAGLDLLRTDPAVGKELRDELAGLRSLRVGRLRIVYRVAGRRLIDLVAIGPRRTIYQETLRLLRRT